MAVTPSIGWAALMRSFAFTYQTCNNFIDEKDPVSAPERADATLPCDLILTAKNGSIKVHKILMVATSPIIATLANITDESDPLSIPIDLDIEQLHAWANYVYGLPITTPQEALSVVIASDFLTSPYDIKALSHLLDACDWWDLVKYDGISVIKQFIVDRMRQAVNTNNNSLLKPGGVVMHPRTYQKIRNICIELKMDELTLFTCDVAMARGFGGVAEPDLKWFDAAVEVMSEWDSLETIQRNLTVHSDSWFQVKMAIHEKRRKAKNATM